MLVIERVQQQANVAFHSQTPVNQTPVLYKVRGLDHRLLDCRLVCHQLPEQCDQCRGVLCYGTAQQCTVEDTERLGFDEVARRVASAQRRFVELVNRRHQIDFVCYVARTRQLPVQQQCGYFPHRRIDTGLLLVRTQLVDSALQQCLVARLHLLPEGGGQRLPLRSLTVGVRVQRLQVGLQQRLAGAECPLSGFGCIERAYQVSGAGWLGMGALDEEGSRQQRVESPR